MPAKRLTQKRRRKKAFPKLWGKKKNPKETLGTSEKKGESKGTGGEGGSKKKKEMAQALWERSTVIHASPYKGEYLARIGKKG